MASKDKYGYVSIYGILLMRAIYEKAKTHKKVHGELNMNRTATKHMLHSKQQCLLRHSNPQSSLSPTDQASYRICPSRFSSFKDIIK